MRVLVYGAGAVGSVLGGFLARGGHDVTLLGRAWHLDAVRAEGLQISSIWGEHRIRRFTLAAQPGDCRGPWDWVLLCVKAYQTAEAARTLPSLLTEHTLICACQNGLGNYEALTAAIPAPRVALGRVIFGAELQPGRVRVTVSADEVLLGAPDPSLPRARLAELAAALAAGGVPCRTTERIIPAIWGKVLYNCSLNALSTLLEVPYGRLLEHPQARRLMERIVEEAYAVAAAQGVALVPPTAAEYQALLFGRLIPDTAAHEPSMLQDVRRGRPTEIEALNGAITRLAQAKGLPAPANALVARLVRAKEQWWRR